MEWHIQGVRTITSGISDRLFRGQTGRRERKSAPELQGPHQEGELGEDMWALGVRM
jgi:hypothetical protein